ncbi:hypothetical protein ACJRO7_013630 [Eucalyptus globulus]|uniref:phospholipase A2 n=1 Tax=Eucalyptus globulus TaxID=34317 RepID=A0ABD3L1C4_EUCGL
MRIVPTSWPECSIGRSVIFMSRLFLCCSSAMNDIPTKYLIFIHSKDRSRKCEAEIIIENDTVPPFLRYGKYCGLLHSGCPEERPYDGLDACCMKHDICIQAKNNEFWHQFLQIFFIESIDITNDYLSQKCSQNLLNCMTNFKNFRGRTFKGSKCQVEDVDVLSIVIEAALLAGRYFHKP